MVKDSIKVIGQSVPLMEANERVSGKYRYVADIPAELYVKILRSPYPHARIKSVDTTKAERLEGVEAILTHKDVPQRLMPRGQQRACYVLEDHLRFAGDEVAAVAARSKAIAEEALGLIEVEYEILPAVFDPEEAMKGDAPKLYPEGNVLGPQLESLIEKGINTPSMYEWGDIEKGFQQAEVVVEDTFEVKPQIHTPIETHVCIASWNRDELTVLVATQCPYSVRDSLAYVLEMPEAKIRVISPAIGGGFGAKDVERYIHITALLSRKARGKSTKITLTREEEQCHAKRGGCKLYVRVGARKDGTITAILFRGYFDIGGYGNPTGGSCNFWGETPAISYKAENVRFEGWDVHTNHFTSQNCRSVHLADTNFALEQAIDEIAEELGMTPAQFRLKNMPESGETMPPQSHRTTLAPPPARAKLDVYPSKKLMGKVMEEAGFERWKGWGEAVSTDGAKRRGIGMAYSAGWSGLFWDGYTSVSVVINKDGSVNILSGTQDLGTGVNTTLRMLAAESLGVALEDVAILTADTSIGQCDFGACSSRSLTLGGHLLLCAIEDAKQKIRKIAGPMLKAKPEDIEVSQKKVFIKEKKAKAIALPQLLTANVNGSATGSPGSYYPEVGPGVKALQPLVQIAEVEVDIETGQVKPLRIVTGNCPGRMINPMIVRGQYTGGAIMSLGLALYEEFNYDEENSTYLSCNLADYRVPRALDTPNVENVILEEFTKRPPHRGLPYGAMGVGEMGCWGTPAAIANAIYNAIGVRVKRAPMTAEVILEALNGKTSK